MVTADGNALLPIWVARGTTMVPERAVSSKALYWMEVTPPPIETVASPVYRNASDLMILTESGMVREVSP